LCLARLIYNFKVLALILILQLSANNLVLAVEQAGIIDKKEQQAVVTKKSGKEVVYTPNNWLRDFEIHFFVSLPFTTLYSYLSLNILDTWLQEKFPPKLNTVDIWMITSLAIGVSLGIALGSIDNVPPQDTLEFKQPEIIQDRRESKYDKIDLIKVSFEI